MRWVSWLPAALSGAGADGPDARRTVFLRRLHRTNQRRLRGLLLAVVGINLVSLGLVSAFSGLVHGMEVGRTLHIILVAHRILWIVLDIVILILFRLVGAERMPSVRIDRLITGTILLNMLFVVSLILPVYAYYPDVSLYYVAMFCLVPLIRLDARESLLAIGLPAGLLIAGILLADHRSAINLSNVVNLLAMAVLSLVGMRYLFIERVRDLLQRDIISRQQAELGRQALTDELTGLANRRGLTACLDREWRRCLREGGDLAAIMIDIDHFKRYNDTWGHAAGDACLRLVAATLSGCLRRAGDIAARYGGEEFVVLLPGGDAQCAWALAESIRHAVLTCDQPQEGSTASRVTVSLGVAVRLADAFDTPQALLVRADAALYAAKAAGRNRICLDKAAMARVVSLEKRGSAF
ncbi:MAG: GGDEF domain-containing protein [Solidesulfovibrio sp.]